ncbi:type II secretion system F family protein [Streptomyces durmitorensis]|uniref:Type II secretion system F family protein n=1 Tax=Streptomyces durmitorensis TaxID=319947 RepID=A0ABY4PTV4_9ACTN|nr:type II secretion system F family protein [Streptomyces durmitorensis]UQT57257.1 type II secretion system F family protein [Streptomyces durmitorensis]
MSAVGVAAAVCAGSAAWLTVGRDRGLRRARAVLAGGGEAGPGDAAWRRAMARATGRVRHEWWALAGGAAVALLGDSIVPLVLGAAGVPLIRRVRRARDARLEGERRAAAVIALCGALAGEVRAGRQPGEALRAAAGGDLGLADAGAGAGAWLGEARAGVLAAARFGGDVPGALEAAAREPGAQGLLGLAACWRVAVDRGAGLAAGLERLEGALRAERDQRGDLRAQLAGARSTAVMLAGLPVLGLLMGSALGAAPLRVLLHTGPGLGCLAVGGVLEGAGVWWALRIVRGAEER